MRDKILAVRANNGVMALATNRPDGWPQVTTVSYVNAALILYCLISRTRQKFANIGLDTRVAVCIGSQAASPGAIEGLSLSARAREVSEEPFRNDMLKRLSARHPGYFEPEQLDLSGSALIRPRPQVISIVDFSNGLGHCDCVTVDAAQDLELTAERPNDWGGGPRDLRGAPSTIGAAARSE